MYNSHILRHKQKRSVMATVPDFVELLNPLAPAEKRAGVFLKAWADKTPDPELKACLSLVAARETSHYDVLKRRIEELCYTLVEEEDPDFHERLLVLCSDMPDIEKIRWQQAKQQRQQQQQGPTLRERYEAAATDEAIDPLTRSLFKYFAEEENDSRNLIGEAYASVETKAG